MPSYAHATDQFFFFHQSALSQQISPELILTYFWGVHGSSINAFSPLAIFDFRIALPPPPVKLHLLVVSKITILLCFRIGQNF